MKKHYLGLILITVLLLQGCNMIQLESLWKDREITIDGNDKDWIDAKYYLKDYNVVVGVMNDDDFLYLCFYPTTQKVKRRKKLEFIFLWE
jgi:calcineurin-like phosphoesterase family protein